MFLVPSMARCLSIYSAQLGKVPLGPSGQLKVLSTSFGLLQAPLQVQGGQHSCPAHVDGESVSIHTLALEGTVGRLQFTKNTPQLLKCLQM